jgi:hypothetical protein
MVAPDILSWLVIFLIWAWFELGVLWSASPEIKQTLRIIPSFILFLIINDMPVNLATQIICHSSKKDYWPSVAQDRIVSLAKINLNSALVNDRCWTGDVQASWLCPISYQAAAAVDHVSGSPFLCSISLFDQLISGTPITPVAITRVFYFSVDMGYKKSNCLVKVDLTNIICDHVLN